jgi:hypothetical protein
MPEQARRMVEVAALAQDNGGRARVPPAAATGGRDFRRYYQVVPRAGADASAKPAPKPRKTRRPASAGPRRRKGPAVSQGAEADWSLRARGRPVDVVDRLTFATHGLRATDSRSPFAIRPGSGGAGSGLVRPSRAQDGRPHSAKPHWREGAATGQRLTLRSWLDQAGAVEALAALWRGGFETVDQLAATRPDTAQLMQLGLEPALRKKVLEGLRDWAAQLQRQMVHRRKSARSSAAANADTNARLQQRAALRAELAGLLPRAEAVAEADGRPTLEAYNKLKERMLVLEASLAQSNGSVRGGATPAGGLPSAEELAWALNHSAVDGRWPEPINPRDV